MDKLSSSAYSFGSAFSLLDCYFFMDDVDQFFNGVFNITLFHGHMSGAKVRRNQINPSGRSLLRWVLGKAQLCICSTPANWPGSRRKSSHQSVALNVRLFSR